jgi:16S rRNA (cytidine1402-2'-O)-methyltransferase
MTTKDAGMLYFCATPIGNLEDITLRVLRILKEVDYIAAEDTRHTLKLLNHFGISKPLISYHQHNMDVKGKEIIKLIIQGSNIAIVSDAGMPAISDPGFDLVLLARQDDIPITVLPGASAALTGLVLSGICPNRFVFEGFLPKEKKERRQILSSLINEQRTIILYEAPHRLLTTLNDLFEYMGERNIAITRELTKIHEQVLSMNIKEAIAYFQVHRPRGEFVLIIEGAKQGMDQMEYANISIEDQIVKYMEAGLDKKEAVKQVAKDRKVPKNEIYKHSLNI